MNSFYDSRYGTYVRCMEGKQFRDFNIYIMWNKFTLRDFMNLLYTRCLQNNEKYYTNLCMKKRIDKRDVFE